MTFGRNKNDDLIKIVGKIQPSEILSAFKYIDSLGVPSKRKSDTCYFVYNKNVYPIKLVTECINNDIKKNIQKIGSNDHDSWQDACLYDNEMLPNGTELITLYNPSGQELVQKFRQELLEKFKMLEVQDVNDSYTKIRKCNKNIAEIHFLNKKENKFKVVVNCDLLPKDMVKDKPSINGFRKVPDSHKWTLNGEYFVTTNPKTFDFAINALNYIKDFNMSEDNSCESNEYNNILEENNMKPALNQILYGPPGTGKTYNTVVEAIKILNYDKYSEYEKLELSKKQAFYEEELKPEFNRIKNEEKRIEFVTFHQSYSYEEFVEGIKPSLGKGSSLEFEQSDGVFKLISDRAKSGHIDNFDEAYEEFIKTIEEYCLENEKECFDEIFTDKFKRQFGLSVNSAGNLNLHTGPNLIHQASITKDNLKNISNLDYYVTYAKAIIKYMEENCGYTQENTELLPHVLIIDEINRGNISKIFGELITLIEEDKREKVVEDGKDYHTIEVTLPYSKSKFTVPNNLYIIGTMNTADKSLALLDVALRRRFEFIPMYPKYDVDNLKHVEFLKALNDTIYKEKQSADYLIGHSYFIGEKDLAKILNNKVIPLLMEYFNAKQDKVKEIIEPLLKKTDYCIDEEEKYLLKVKKNG